MPFTAKHPKTDSKSAEGNLVGARPPSRHQLRCDHNVAHRMGTLFLSSLLVLSRGHDIKPNPHRNIDPKGCQLVMILPGMDARRTRFPDPLPLRYTEQTCPTQRPSPLKSSCTSQSALSSRSSRSSPSSACSTMAAPSPSSRATAKRPPATSTRSRSATSRRS